MMRDNEKIIALIAECQQFIKAKTVEAIAADARPDTLRGFVEILHLLDCLVNNMGDRRSHREHEMQAQAHEMMQAAAHELQRLAGGDRNG